MNLTAEQVAIINSTGNIKINAVAGSGKTTTVIEYARTRPAGSRVLYLAFNRTVRMEAGQRFAKKGMHNVAVETNHSLAYRYIVKGTRYKVRAQGYKPYELVELLQLTATGGGTHEHYVLASHISKFLAYFCNSPVLRVQELDYRSIVHEPLASAFVAKHYAAIERGCRVLLQRMNEAQIEITHDFYLKKFQLAAPQLPYDYILFDEAQDASGSMLALFLQQPATKVMVGDTHQQIYGWRHAVNSLEKADFATFDLSTSFRFAEPIAHLATSVLAWKAEIGPHSPVLLSGLGTSTETTTKAVIGRTNLGLLLKAIEYITGPEKVQRVYFEGNINSYTYAEDGASLYDVLHLYNGRSNLIRDPLIKQMANLDELQEYAEQTEDAQLAMLIKIVEDYGNDVIDLIKELKRRHVADGERHRAQIYFSTVHRCKGLEYDEVQLASDFVGLGLVGRWGETVRRGEATAGELAKWNEEINLLYVALTRAKYRLHLPEESRPQHVLPSEQVRPYYGSGGTILTMPVVAAPEPAATEAPVAAARKAPALRPPSLLTQDPVWTEQDDLALTARFCADEGIRLISEALERPIAEVWDRIRKLELDSKYGA